MTAIAILNGPNLSLLGLRQPEVYGTATLSDIEDLARRIAAEVGLSISRFVHAEGEGELLRERQHMPLIVFDPRTEAIVQWVPRL